MFQMIVITGTRMVSHFYFVTRRVGRECVHAMHIWWNEGKLVTPVSGHGKGGGGNRSVMCHHRDSTTLVVLLARSAL